MAQLQTLERDGFQITNKIFRNPPNSAILDPVSKRKVTICNLFSNHELHIKDIVRILDEGHGHVISILIEQGLIYERRKTPGTVKIERRGSLFRRH